MSLHLNKPRHLKIRNAQLALQTIRDNPGISRAQLSRECGMSKPTASLAAHYLRERKLIVESEIQNSAVGRNAIGLSLNETSVWLLGIVVDVTLCCVFAGTLGGKILEQRIEFETGAGWNALVKKLESACAHMLSRFPAPPLGCAISMPGITNDTTGDIIYCPNIHFLDGKNLVAHLQNLHSFPIIQIQEVRAVAFGALSQKSTSGYKNIFCVEIGEGVGGALVVDGVLHAGSHFSAGEIGHVPAADNNRLCGCGRRGCLETLLGEQWLIQSWAERYQHHNSLNSFADICARFRDEARAIVFAALPALISALQYVIAAFDPDAILLHGAVWNAVEGSVEHVADSIGSKTPVIHFGGGRSAGLLALIFERIIIKNMEEETV
jgi:predicted NBD/HSP70 family sugar kinase